MFLPLFLLLEYGVEHDTVGPLYIEFVLSTRISYRVVLDPVTDYNWLITMFGAVNNSLAPLSEITFKAAVFMIVGMCFIYAIMN